MDSNHPRRLYESRVLPTELASLVFPRKLAGRAGFEPAHGVSNSHLPFQLGYRQKNIRKKRKAPTFVGASEIESELGNLANDQTNPGGRARLMRRLIMDLVLIVIFEAQYSTASVQVTTNMLVTDCAPSVFLGVRPERRTRFAFSKSIANHACY